MAKNKKTSPFRNKVKTDVAKQQSESSSFGYLRLPDKVKMFKEKPKETMYLDIIPYRVTDKKHNDRNADANIAMPGELWYKRPFKIHRDIGIDNDAVVCLTSFGKKCPICEYRSKRANEGAEVEELKALKAKQRNLYAVIPIDHSKYDEEVHIWDISQFLFQKQLNEEVGEDSSYEVFPCLEEGLTLKIRFKEEQFGKGKPFAKAGRIDFKERNEIYDEDILDEVPNLDELLIETSYDELNNKFMELDEDDVADKDDAVTEDVTEEETTKPSKRRKKKTKPDIDLEEPEKVDLEEGEEYCTACEGTGKDSKGRDCPICDGTGIMPEEEPEEQPEPEEEKEKPKKKKKKDEGKDKGKKSCPHGHTWGTDCDEEDECEDCEKWDECIDDKVD